MNDIRNRSIRTRWIKLCLLSSGKIPFVITVSQESSLKKNTTMPDVEPAMNIHISIWTLISSRGIYRFSVKVSLFEILQLTCCNSLTLSKRYGIGAWSSVHSGWSWETEGSMTRGGIYFMLFMHSLEKDLQNREGNFVLEYLNSTILFTRKI